MSKKPKSARKPWMRFYGNDFYGGVIGFTLAQEAAYQRLLWASWESEDGTLPADDAWLMRAANCEARNWHKTIRPVVLGKFRQLPDGRIFNQRLMEERRSAGRPSVTAEDCTGMTVPGYRTPGSKFVNKNSLGALHHGVKTSTQNHNQSPERISSGNFSARPQGASDQVSAPSIPSASLLGSESNKPASSQPSGTALPAEAETAESVTLKNLPARPDGRGKIFDRSDAEDEDIPAHLLTPLLRRVR